MSRPPRVALLSLHRGAMSHYAAGIANAVVTARPESQVACFCPDDADPDLFDPAVALFRYAVPQVLSARGLAGLTTLPFAARRILSDILGWKPGVLHINSGHIAYPLFVPRLASRMPVVSTIHDVYPHLGEHRPVERIKLFCLLRYSRRIMVNGERLREQAIERWQLADDRVVVMPVIMTSRIGEWAAGVKESPFEILMFGRIHSYKGFEVMLKALPDVVRRFPGARLAIVGEGSLKPWAGFIEPLRAHIDVQNRFVPDREMARFFRRAAVVAVPYVEASQTGVEPIAACFEKPVVGTRIGALPEAIADGETGLLVPPNDPAALADAIATLLGNPKRRREMGRHACQKRYGPGVEKDLGERVCRVYDQAV